MTKSNVFTAVFREVTPDEAGEITHHPKWSAGSWSHAIDDRKEAEIALQLANARIAELEADLSFQKQVVDAARQNQADLLDRAQEAETRIADLEAQKLTEPAQVGGAVFRPGIAWETVIKAAQRNYRYRNDPATNDYPDRFTLEQIQAMDKIIPQDDREFVSLEDYRALARELAALAQQEKP